MNDRGYECFVCKGIIPEAAPGATAFDPCAITLTTNISADWKDQREQQFFCHLDCFRAILQNDRILYLLKEDFSSRGDFIAERQDLREVSDWLLDTLEMEPARSALWRKVQQHAIGHWQPLADLVAEDDALGARVRDVERLAGDRIYISWIEDWAEERVMGATKLLLVRIPNDAIKEIIVPALQ